MLLLLALSLSTLAQDPDPGAETVTTATADAAPAAYGVGARDLLEIEVFQEDSLTGEYVVAEDGTIDFPLLGKVQVDGLSPGQVDTLLTEQLAADYLVDPQVKVRVASYASKSVRVLGAVEKPGVYQLTGPTSVLEIVAQAGGMSEDGVTELHVTRKGGQTDIIRLDELATDEEAWLLQQGDTVLVPPPKVVYVSGEVAKPGAVAFTEGMTVSQAVILAGGAKTAANLRKVFVKRGGAKIRVNLRKVNDGREEDLVLLPDDQVLISESVL